MINHSYTTEDRDYLEELMGYFPVSPPISIDQAQLIIKDRCQFWDPYKFVETYTNKFGKTSFYNVLRNLPCILHRGMFNDILSNAGKYRESTDIHTKGCVEFGLPVKKFLDGADSSSGKFTGFSTGVIQEMVKDISELLLMHCQDPFHNAAKYYQKFVRIHPFYDGNGRIGRYVVDAYLISHSMYIDWEMMKKNMRWIRQLNYCHRKMNEKGFIGSYTHAFKWWLYYLNKFKHNIDQKSQ